MRVGLDSQDLPVHLPAEGTRPEMFLVISADNQTLLALDAVNGVAVWRYPLGATCLGRPLVIDSRVYVPTYDGIVHEIELAKGHLLGRYHLGQRLTVGGTRQENTKLLYFPADDSCVFVLDVEKHRCQAILYSWHPSGSLRSEPIIASWPISGGGIASVLILPQTDGLKGTILRTFSLPIPNGVAQQPEKPTGPRVQGWSWFEPFYDGEKLVLATDAGIVAPFGIPQSGTDTPSGKSESPLFPWLPEEFKLPAPVGSPPGQPSRSQVAYALDSALWVLSQGGLDRLEMTIAKATGPKIVSMWPSPLWLGSPLHASQVDEKGDSLFVVTQSLTRQSCLATKVDADRGKVIWQRQLGLISQGDPLPLGKDKEPAVVLVQDQGGRLFLFDPRTSGPKGQPIADVIEHTKGPIYLVPAGDGSSAYQFASVEKEKNRFELLVRHFSATAEGPRPAPQTYAPFEISAPLAGPPAVGSRFVLLPLTDGTIWRMTRDGKKDKDGPDWRSNRASSDLRAYVVWLNDDEFLTVNGDKGITRYTWPANADFSSIPNNRSDASRPTKQMQERIAAAPLVIPAAVAPGGELQVCVADSLGTVWLLQGRDLKQELRQWKLPAPGTLTAGPFWRAGQIGCIVEHHLLVWLDPSQDGLLWEHDQHKHIVGEPQLIEGKLVVADQSGHYSFLDPKTGKDISPGYVLKASVAPAASAVAFGPHRAFAPLTDGTVLLLSLPH
jgi:hypothetical protein